MPKVPIIANLSGPAWRYGDADRRDARLDLLRGWALLAMFINHFGGESWLYAVSGHETLYTSAAEPFYVISGLVLGVVAARQSLGTAVRRVLRRAWVLYLGAVGIALGFLALGLLTDLRLWYDLQDEVPRAGNVASFVVGVLTLHDSFHGGQVLVLFVAYLVVSPLALLACADGRGWLVLLGSGLVYAASQRYPEAVTVPIATYAHPAAWQPLFFVGLVLGYHRARFGGFDRVPAVVRGGLEIAVLAAAGYFLWVHVGGYDALPWLPDALGDREGEMRPLRLALVALYLVAFFLLATRFWRPLSGVFGWLLLPIGRASLWCYAAHLIVIVLVYNLPAYDRDAGRLAGTCWQTGAVLAVWGTVKARNRLHLRWTGVDVRRLHRGWT